MVFLKLINENIVKNKFSKLHFLQKYDSHFKYTSSNIHYQYSVKCALFHNMNE